MTSPDLDTFVADAHAWLDGVAEPRTRRSWGEGSDSVAVFENWTAEQEREETDRARAYERAKFDAGFGAITWPEQYGGRDLPASYLLAFRRAEARYDVPRRTEMFPVTQQLIAPTIAQWGTEEQRATYVRAMLRTENARSTLRRSRACSGGSEFAGCSVASGSTASIAVTASARSPRNAAMSAYARADENVSGSRSTFPTSR